LPRPKAAITVVWINWHKSGNPNIMAKKKANGVNVSEAIRNAWDADQSQKPAAVVQALKAKGIKTNPNTVATTLSAYRRKLGMKPLRKKRRGKRGSVDAMPTGVGSVLNVANVLEAVKLVTKAKELVGAAGLKEIVRAI
jgi:hypothetical protein